tara:strand:+ start:6766 stop:9438 length:2673 start_codon:yes stop_codon:yes gene_type:complete
MRIILILLITLSSSSLKASHIVGGEIYYDYLGNNNYRFFISVYRDCLSDGASFDSPLSLGVFNGNNLIQDIQVPFNGSSLVPVVFNNPCVTPPTNICTEHSLYSVVLTLPPSANGYTIAYQRCCRGPNINNLINPDDTGFTLSCFVPSGSNNNFVNSSPRFVDYPPLLLCNNEDLVFDHSATDPDGDQLIYSFTTPFSGATSINPAPNPPPGPPYANVIWSGVVASNPLGAGASISIDPTTGILTASPNLLGRFVVGIQVQELRNGVVINRTLRDFIFRVFNCQLQLESILPAQEDLPDFISYCQGLEVNFVNNSYNGTNYAWDFGVVDEITDVSTVFEPSFTYPEDGIYEVTLIVNPGWPCTDTAYMDINVNNEILVSYTSNDSLCIFNNSFDFVGTTNGPAGSELVWDFGSSANIETTNGNIINNIEFSETGFIPIELSVSFGLCTTNYIDSIYIFPEPVAEIILPDNIECGGLEINFGNNSLASINYNWDFGVTEISTDVSNEFSPTFNFVNSGTYTVTLMAGSTDVCVDTTQATITVNKPLVVDFTSQDSMCVTDNSFDFISSVSGPSSSVFTWDFGNLASVTSSTNTNELGVSFLGTGQLPITLTGAFENCIETITHTIYIYQEPQINFILIDELQCEPYLAHFTDLSFAETGISYIWDFGNNENSTEQNPSTTYQDTGSYPVTLTISTSAGCIRTLSLTQPDLVTVRPSPIAGFSIDPSITDICNSSVNFTDESSLAMNYYYYFDDGTFNSNESNPSHLYHTSGTHRPSQLVISEFGCRDSISSELYIEPFNLFVPNTFTPDGNEFNSRFLPVVDLSVEEWKLEIFNRWGELVFVSNDVNIGWNGTNKKGVISQDGTYVWKVTYTSCAPINPEEIFTGTINLLR